MFLLIPAKAASSGENQSQILHTLGKKLKGDWMPKLKGEIIKDKQSECLPISIHNFPKLFGQNVLYDGCQLLTFVPFYSASILIIAWIKDSLVL